MSYRVLPSDLSVVMLGETLFVAIVVGTYWAVSRLNPIGARVPGAVETSRESERRLLLVLILIGVFVYAGEVLNPTTNEAYVERATGLAVYNISELMQEWLSALFWLSPLVASCWVIFDYSRQKFRVPLLVRSLAILNVVLVVAMGLAGGYRGRVTLVLSVVVVVAYLRKRRRMIYAAITVLVIFLPFATFFRGTMRSQFYGAAATGGLGIEFINRGIDELGVYVSGGGLTDSGSNLIRDVAFRAQGPRNSAVLYGLYSDGGAAGMRPYAGAVMFPVPRMLWSGKPVAGSSDGSTIGRADYIVQRVGYLLPDQTMGPVLASAHAYWEGGPVWLVLVGILTGAMWALIVGWCERVGGVLAVLVLLSFASAFMIDGLMTVLFPAYTLILAFWKYFVPLQAIHLLCRFSWNGPRSIATRKVSGARGLALRWDS